MYKYMYMYMYLMNFPGEGGFGYNSSTVKVRLNFMEAVILCSYMHHCYCITQAHPCNKPWSISVHDESHDGLEVVSMEGHLGLLRHMHAAGMPRSLAVTQTLHPLTTVGRLE